jgi:GAF domain
MKDMEQSTEDNGQRWEMALRATTCLLKIFSFPDFFAAAAERLAQLLGADGVALIVCEEPGQLRYKLFHGVEQLNQTPIVKFSFSASQGTVGRALASGQALFTADYPSSADAMPEFVAAGLRANLVVPLPSPAGFSGAIAVSWLYRHPAERRKPHYCRDVRRPHRLSRVPGSLGDTARGPLPHRPTDRLAEPTHVHAAPYQRAEACLP